MSLDQAVSQRLIINDKSANRGEVSASSCSSNRSLIGSASHPPEQQHPQQEQEQRLPPSSLRESPSPISFLTDGGDSAGGLSPGSAASATYSSFTSSGSASTSTCPGYSIITPTSSSGSLVSTTTATVKSGGSPTSKSRTIKFNDSSTTTIQYSPSDPVDGRANNSNGRVSASSKRAAVGSGAGGRSGGGLGGLVAAMSTHHNSTNNSSSTAKSPTSIKPPSSPVKFGSKSKSRHSSSSDQSTCVTPTGGSGGGGGSTTSGIAGMGPGPDGLDRAHSIRVTRKIFNNWRSACGRTKDKTKDFIRRWKTLPENPADCEGGSESESQHLHHNSPLGSSGNVYSLGGLGNSMEQSSGGGGGGCLTNMNSSSSAAGGESAPGGGKTSSFGKIKSLTKKFSQDVASEDMGSSSISQSKPSAGWSVHVWATYVQRGLDDEDALSTKEEAKPGRDLLTDFQKTKLTHFFRHVLDMNHDDVISAADFVALNQRIRHYIEWSPECIEFHVLKEVHSGFLECFLNQPLDDCSVMYYCSNEKETRDHVNLDEWLDVWGTLLESARTLEDLPLWLQYFPKILFQVINKSGSQKVSKEELRAFYTMFLGIDFRVVNDTLDSIYNAMTDGGKNPINYCLFKLCFSNFLLGKYPHGPGQYMFGICSPQSLHCNFPIDYSAMNTPPDDLEPYDPHKEKDHSRRSVIV